MSPEQRAELRQLADRVEATTKSDNALDVLVEVALFEPAGDGIACRANAAGTKVIYTLEGGREVTHRAADWTMGVPMRRTVARRLRVRADEGEGK